MAQSLRVELRKHGVDVLALCPGVTSTEFHGLAGTRPVAAMPVEPVVAAAPETLGKRSAVVTGWHNRMLVFFLRFAPRWTATVQAGRVREGLVLKNGDGGDRPDREVDRAQ